MKKQVKVIYIILTKLMFLRLTTTICIYFDKSEGEFISVPKQHTMKLYRQLGDKRPCILTSALRESVMSFHAAPV
jgi:hypothetical protein